MNCHGGGGIVMVIVGVRNNVIVGIGIVMEGGDTAPRQGEDSVTQGG